MGVPSELIVLGQLLFVTHAVLTLPPIADTVASAVPVEVEIVMVWMEGRHWTAVWVDEEVPPLVMVDEEMPPRPEFPEVEPDPPDPYTTEFAYPIACCASWLIRDSASEVTSPVISVAPVIRLMPLLIAAFIDCPVTWPGDVIWGEVPSLHMPPLGILTTISLELH